MPVEFSKGEWGRGQEEINLRYAEALEMADRHVLYKHGVKEIAYQQGCSVTFMAKYDMGAAGSSFHLHSSLWDRPGGASPVRGAGRRPAGHAAVPAVAGRSDGDGARARLLLRAHRELLQALPGRARSRPTRIACGLGQSHLRLPPLRRGRAASASRTASPAPTPTPISPSPPPSPRGCTASARSWSRPRSTRAMPTRTRRCPRCRRRCARRSPSSSGSQVAREAFGTAGRRALPPARAARAAGVRPGRDRLGADPELRANLGPSPRPSPLRERRKDEADARTARGQGRADHRRGNGHGTRGVGALRRGGRARRGLRHRTARRPRETVELVRKAGGEALAVVGDVAVEADVRAHGRGGRARASARCTSSTTTRACSGRTATGRCSRRTASSGTASWRINLKSVFWVTKYGIPHLQAAGGGSIILMGSVSALAGFTRAQDAYTAAKGALISLNKSLAIQFAKDNIRSQRDPSGHRRDAAAGAVSHRRAAGGVQDRNPPRAGSASLATSPTPRCSSPPTSRRS